MTFLDQLLLIGSVGIVVAWLIDRHYLKDQMERQRLHAADRVNGLWDRCTELEQAKARAIHRGDCIKEVQLRLREEIGALEARLAPFDRCRGAGGRYIKGEINGRRMDGEADG